MEIYRNIKKQAETGAGRYFEYFQALGITAVIARLFYKSWAACILFVPICYFYRRYCHKRRKESGKRQLLKEFRDGMEMIKASLLAGYSLENAFVDAQKELAALYSSEGGMQEELKRINQQVEMNQPLERVFGDFAGSCGVEEIENFSEILMFAKRSGGDLIRIIQGTVENITDKIQIEEEIQTMIAEKKLEQKVMNAAPLFVLFYLDITSPGYLDVLYQNLGGILVMTLCLIGYMAAVLLSERMGKIEV